MMEKDVFLAALCGDTDCIISEQPGFIQHAYASIILRPKYARSLE